MCGFVAIRTASGTPVAREALEAGAQSIVHRGPDDSGFFIEQNLGLGFRRLSIIDLSDQSHQPFEDPDGRLVLVFNGEIFNYVELRDELEALGHTFRTAGDTEVLLNAYKEWGEDCVSRLNGMWAFIVYDRVSRCVFGSRDRFGIKPLYSARAGETRVFASEIKAIYATGLIERVANWNTVASYLIDSAISSATHNNQTFFEAIEEIPAGSCFTVDERGKFRNWKFWSLPVDQPDPQVSPIDELRELLSDAVRLRMRSDVPVGVCLSGGIDSTAIICLMAEVLGSNRDQPLNAFSYIDANYDETKEIEATIELTSATLHKLTGSVDTFLERLDHVLAFHDEPFHSLNVLISFELYRMAAAAGVKVVLNGQGADETWAGYSSYFRNWWYTLVASGRIADLKRELNAFHRMHGKQPDASLSNSIGHFARHQLRRSRVYRNLSASRHRRGVRGHPWFSQQVFENYEPNVPEFEEMDIHSSLRRSVEQHSLPLYLRVEDRNSMAHSIETRLPFLDYRLVTLAMETGADWYLDGGWNKDALRKAMKGIIPDRVREREDKMGFPVSARDWFAGPLNETVRHALSDGNGSSHYLNKDAVLRDLDAHRRGGVDHSADLLKVLQLQMLNI